MEIEFVSFEVASPHFDERHVEPSSSLPASPSPIHSSPTSLVAHEPHASCHEPDFEQLIAAAADDQDAFRLISPSWPGQGDDAPTSPLGSVTSALDSLSDSGQTCCLDLDWDASEAGCSLSGFAASMDLDPMAALFAFNSSTSSCNSPACPIK